ncbi:MAG: hypothetical protein ABII07_00535 [Patescibacteria group bacterium]
MKNNSKQSGQKEIVIFDADEFNNGKGVDLEVFYQALKESLEE